MIHPRFLFAIPGLFLIAGCERRSTPEAAAAPPADAVARAGSAWLLQSDVDHAVRTGAARGPAEALKALTEEESLAQFALSGGLDKDPSVRAAVRRMLAARCMEAHLAASTAITDADVQAAWEQSGDRFLTPASARLAVLRRRIGNDDSAARDSLEKASAAFAALPEEARRKGFGPLAVEHSDDNDTRYQGGDCGWVLPGQGHPLLPPPVVAVAGQRQQGEAPELVRGGDSWWLVLVMESRPAARQPLAVVAPRLRSELEAAAAAGRRAELLAKVAAAVPLEIIAAPPAAAAPLPGPVTPPPVP